MSDKDHVKSLLKESNIYKSQGLFKEAMARLQETLRFVENHPQFSKDAVFLDALEKKIGALDAEMKEVEAASDAPELSEDVQGLITRLFSFSQNRETASIEGAVALANFGQYEKAVSELEKLIQEGKMPLMAAMNLLRCHLTHGSPEAAIAQFKKWDSRSLFLKGDLNYLRNFLEKTLSKRGIPFDLPAAGDGIQEPEAMEESEEDLLPLSSVGFEFEGGGDALDELEVSCQTGNRVSIIIPGSRKPLVEALKPGQKLEKVQCFSPIAVFSASAVVQGKSIISSGPKKGDYSLDLTISGG
ncbi:MAG: hypothetical protein JW821_17200 [Deltaproteobacteria bacterium]|nr:hypothetical protein [Deltaproteobacteria bacterium]